MLLRGAHPSDLPELRAVERAAGEAFRMLGMDAVADDEPMALGVLDAYRRAGRALVADDGSGRPCAYLVHEPVDGATHIEQVTVHPRVARRGVGRSLIEALADRADGALTLTTYAEVPWNAPYYTRLGFRVLAETELTAGLRRIRRAEAARGLDAWPRSCMRREARRTRP